MKTFFAVCVYFCVTTSCFSQYSNTWSVKFADAIRTRWNETPVGGRVCIDKMTSKNWEYSNGIVLSGFEKVYNQTNTAAYRTYIKTYVDDYIDGSGNILQTVNSLDRLHPAILLLFLYADPATSAADKARYKTAADYSRNLLVGPTSTYSKTWNGILWHKLSGYNNIMMLDGIYMAHPFLAKYGSMFSDNAAIDTAVNQTLFAYNQLYDPTTHLIKHAWSSTPASYSWANNTTGNSSEVWSRAMGWYMMALVDILKYVPVAHPKRAQLLTALDNLAVGIKDYQDATTGLWYQVVDKGVGHPGYTSANYIESSGSSMFVYALKTAIDSGWISSATYSPVAQSGWNGLKTIEITTAGDGMPQINNYVPGMSVQNDYNAYVGVAPVDCPSSTAPHGYAAILMAASAMEFSPITLPVKFLSFTAKENTSNTLLSWENADQNEVDHYEIERSVNGNNFTVVGTLVKANTTLYSWTDADINIEKVYYRIKAVSADGSFYYSTIISLKRNNRAAIINISPNPVRNGNMNVGLSNLEPGKYNVRLINCTGKVIQSVPVVINDHVNTVRTISLLQGISRGVYFVKVEGDNMITSKSILIE